MERRRLRWAIGGNGLEEEGRWVWVGEEDERGEVTTGTTPVLEARKILAGKILLCCGRWQASEFVGVMSDVLLRSVLGPLLLLV